MSISLNRRRVVITGLSVVSPLGNTIADLTHNIFSGVSGIKLLDAEFVDKLDCKIAAQAHFDPADHFSKHTYGMLDRTSQMALHTSIEAIKDASLEITDQHTAAGQCGTGSDCTSWQHHNPQWQRIQRCQR